MQSLQQYKSKGKQTLEGLRKELLYGHKNSQLNCGFFIDPYRFGGGVVGGWKELGRTTLGSAASSLSVSSLPDKRYYKAILYAIPTASMQPRMQLNGDAGANYASRYSKDSGADVLRTSVLGLSVAAFNITDPTTSVTYISNKSSNEKLAIAQWIYQNTAGAGTAPSRLELVGKHVQTTNPINTITFDNNGEAGNFNTGSELVILGFDPADTHTDNFWTELASVELGSTSTNLSTGAFSAKKYLWIQAYIKVTASLTESLTFNNDTGANYSDRYSANGGADSTNTSTTNINLQGAMAVQTLPRFYNMFIINKSTNEKLCICNSVWQNTAGSGTAPQRKEHVFKWTNTASQITEIDLDVSTSTFASGSIIKVWGSD